ncbi:MAG: hypothetical protein WAU45_04665 [Blastocatellia bacterium]
MSRKKTHVRNRPAIPSPSRKKRILIAAVLVLLVTGAAVARFVGARAITRGVGSVASPAAMDSANYRALPIEQLDLLFEKREHSGKSGRDGFLRRWPGWRQAVGGRLGWAVRLSHRPDINNTV